MSHFKLDQVWRPSLQGQITTISWESWYRVANSSEFAGSQLAARQGGSVYLAPNTYFEPQLFSSNWQRASGSIAALDFNKFSGSGPQDLDFSSSAASIEFGYLLSRGVFQSGTTNYRASFYTLTIESNVPEPGAVALLAAGIAALLCTRRRSFVGLPA